MRPMWLSMRLLLVACVVARAVALPPGVADSVWQTPPPAVVGLAYRIARSGLDNINPLGVID